MGKSTRELVLKTASELFVNGEKPTVVAIRALIKQGSNTTIQAALNDWWSELSLQFKKLQSHPDVPEDLGNVISQVWLDAVKKAEENIGIKLVDLTEKLQEEKNRNLLLNSVCEAQKGALAHAENALRNSQLLLDEYKKENARKSC